jgi:hypothetical protein
MARRPEGSTIPLVKPRQLLAVEHPCHVRDAERAVGMLGGVRAIAKASRDGTAFLECHMRPHDSLSHPLFGELVRTPGVLLKVRRKRDGGAGAALSTEVVGVVKHSYRFAGLADFQYVSSPQLLDALRALPTAETAAAPLHVADGAAAEGPKPPGSWLDECAFAQHGCNVPPALFLSRDLPLDFLQLRPEAASRPGLQGSLLALEEEEQRPRQRRARRRVGGTKMFFGSVVDFGVEEVPQAADPDVQRQVEAADPLFVAMSARFAARPIWSRQALRASLRGLAFSDERFKLMLPQGCWGKRPPSARSACLPGPSEGVGLGGRAWPLTPLCGRRGVRVQCALETRASRTPRPAGSSPTTSPTGRGGFATSSTATTRATRSTRASTR